MDNRARHERRGARAIELTRPDLGASTFVSSRQFNFAAVVARFDPAGPTKSPPQGPIDNRPLFIERKRLARIT